MRQKNIIAACGIVTLLAGFSGTANSQSYPAKPLRVVVPFASGTVLDVITRLVGGKMNESMGQPIIVENRPGAGGRTGSEQVARAAPDGYTLLFGTSSTHVSGAFMVKSMPYDSIKDFTPIAPATSAVGVWVVHPSVPAASVKELLAHVRANPGKLAYGSNGVGTSYHLITELIKLSANLDILHVPLSGAGEMMNSLVGGHIQMGFNSVGEIRQHVQAGRLRPLAVITGKRFSALPDLPTLEETVPGYQALDVWFGYFGPAGLPQPIVARLNSEINAGLNAADVRAKLEGAGMQILGGTPQELADRMKREAPIYERIIRAAKIEPQ